MTATTTRRHDDTTTRRHDDTTTRRHDEPPSTVTSRGNSQARCHSATTSTGMAQVRQGNWPGASRLTARWRCSHQGVNRDRRQAGPLRLPAQPLLSAGQRFPQLARARERAGRSQSCAATAQNDPPRAASTHTHEDKAPEIRSICPAAGAHTQTPQTLQPPVRRRPLAM